MFSRNPTPNAIGTNNTTPLISPEYAIHFGSRVVRRIAVEVAIVMEPSLPYLPPALAALRSAARENVRTVCDVDKMLIPTSFSGSVLETAGGAVFLDALYRDPLAFEDRIAGRNADQNADPINSEDCNVDSTGRLR